MDKPTIMTEKIPSATEVLTALKAIKVFLAAGQDVATRDTGKRVMVTADVKSLMDGNPEVELHVILFTKRIKMTYRHRKNGLEKSW